jgi:hypothetical protein
MRTIKALPDNGTVSVGQPGVKAEPPSGRAARRAGT